MTIFPPQSPFVIPAFALINEHLNPSPIVKCQRNTNRANMGVDMRIITQTDQHPYSAGYFDGLPEVRRNNSNDHINIETVAKADGTTTRIKMYNKDNKLNVLTWIYQVKAK